MNEQDLARWETTLEGPKRLRAVVLHDKYPHQLRVQAAMSLIRMKPRRGQRVGIKMLVEKTLAELPSDTRSKILADLVPQLIDQLKQKAPEAQPGQALPPDPSFKYKDAIYMMLTFDRPTLIADPALKKQLTETLTQWAMDDFERRLNDRDQAYGMEQLLRYIGSSSVVGLPELMTKNARSLTKMAKFVATLGDEKTKEAAATRLVEIAKYISSEEWLKDKTPVLEEANRRGKKEPSKELFAKQLAIFQEETLLRVFGSMRQVGGSAATEYCFSVAADKKASVRRRQAAVAALESHISCLEEDDPETKCDYGKKMERLFALVQDKETPAKVLDQCFRRIRELPRKNVVGKLYGLFETDRWKLRRQAAASVLQMSHVDQVDEFMEKLNTLALKNFALSEALAYGAYMGELKDPDDATKIATEKARKAVDRYLEAGKPQGRLSALSYFFSFGTKAEIDLLKPFVEDKQKIPKCSEDDGCGWECRVQKGDDPKKGELKKVETVGEFVQFCVMPRMLVNKPKKDEQAGGEKKDDKKDDKKDEGEDEKDE